MTPQARGHGIVQPHGAADEVSQGIGFTISPGGRFSDARAHGEAVAASRVRFADLAGRSLHP